MAQVAKAEGLATLVALTVTVHPTGGSAGALYLPALLTVPTVELPPAILLTAQVTAVLDVPVTCAVNRLSPPTVTLALVGLTVTVAPGGAARAGATLLAKAIHKESANRN